MPGGLMNLVSQGQQNIILNGNPSKTFFKSTFAQYTNFGLQKFRVDFEGSKTLRLSEESQFVFKIPRYADLLMDTYLSITLPNIWSPIMAPNDINTTDLNNLNTQWIPYEFKWIENIGAKMISKISITCGNYTLQEYSGNYLLAAVQRDFSSTKKNLFDKMIGNVSQLNDPAHYGTRNGQYPNAFYTDFPGGSEPSIKGRILYVPLNNWFSLKSQMAFPLTSLQYNELHINVTFRPVSELFQIRDVFDINGCYPYVAPNFNLYYMQFYRFLQPPPDIYLGINSYSDQRTLWNADIHLNCTYCFLSNDEERLFALQEQKYLIKQVHEKQFFNVTGSNKIELDSVGLISSYMFYFQRSDVNLRNEWSNYTNWRYNCVPKDILCAPLEVTSPTVNNNQLTYGPGLNPDNSTTNLYITIDYNPENNKDILLALGILLDGSYRENIQPAGIYDYIEKYIRTSGNGPDGLYCYNFCINTSPFDLQPSGAINMSRFNQIEFEFTTAIPSLDPLAQSLTICDPETGNIIGINKPTWRIYNYNYDIYLFEERINVVNFIGGNVGMLYAT